MLEVFIVVVLAIISGVLSYGLTFAYFQNRWPSLSVRHRDQDAESSLVVALLASSVPIVVLICVWVIFDFGRYGIKWK